MKIILTLLTLIIFVFNLHGQNIEKLGIDKIPELNEDESLYLNSSLSKRRGYFDFENKKIGFFTGSSNKIWSKQDYFNLFKNTLSDENPSMQDQLLILNEKEKKESGGYDAFIISRSKIFVSEDKKRKLISKIRRSSR